MLSFSVNSNSNSVVRDLSSKVYNPTTDEGREWLSTLWFSALEGKVDENVNTNAYGYACEQNTKMAKAKKETALLTANELDEGLRGVSEAVACYEDSSIENFINDSEVETLVEEFEQVHQYLIVEEGVNLWRVVSLVHQRNQKAIERLRYLCKEYHMEKLIKNIIGNKKCISALEVVMDSPIIRYAS